MADYAFRSGDNDGPNTAQMKRAENPRNYPSGRAKQPQLRADTKLPGDMEDREERYEGMKHERARDLYLSKIANRRKITRF